jgi:two-component system cell cycle response regulator
VVPQGVAGRILTNLRGPDTAVRYGGEEFVILMPDTDHAPALAAAERVCEAIRERKFALPGSSEEVEVTISIGFATELAGQHSLGWLIEKADRALYEAKHAGCNQAIVARENDVPAHEAAGAA